MVSSCMNNISCREQCKQEKATLAQEKATSEQEKASLEQQKTTLEQEKSSLEQEKRGKIYIILKINENEMDYTYGICS